MLERKKIGLRVAEIQQRLGLTGAQLADSLDTSASYISDIKNKYSKPSLEVLERLANRYHIDIEWLLTGNGDMIRERESMVSNGRRMRELPVLGEVPCGLAVSSFTEEHPRETVLVGNISQSREAFILTARGESMLPRIEPGDKLVCQQSELHEVRDGDIVVVSFNTSIGLAETNCKVIRFYDRATRVVLMPLNAEYEAQEFPIRDIHRVYKVKQVIRELR
jgi:SOS-response transcriptional repressor LexA